MLLWDEMRKHVVAKYHGALWERVKVKLLIASVRGVARCWSTARNVRFFTRKSRIEDNKRFILHKNEPTPLRTCESMNCSAKK